MWVLAAMVMLIPIAMVVLSLTMPFPAIRWVCVVASGFLVVFNVAGLPYPAAYDNLLIGVGFVVNAVIIYYAWTWSATTTS